MILFADFIARETYTYILYFVLGALFILASYHLIRYINNKEKPYLYYSLYVFFSFLAYCIVAKEGFIKEILSFIKPNPITKGLFTIIYNSVYFLFFASFLNLKKYNNKHYNIITKSIYWLLGFAFVSYVIAKLSGIDSIFLYYENFYIFCASLLTVYSFYVIYHVKNPLKWFILTGGILLFITSIIGEHDVRNLLNISYQTGDFIFFVGLLLENILFSHALGQKEQREIIKRHEDQENLILELKKNEILQQEINRKNAEQLLLENEKMRIEQANTDLALEALRSQINPHFIYNALHSIKAYIQFNKQQDAVVYLSKFSLLIRLILNSSFEKESNLLAEIKILNLYVEIENLRFNGEINFTTNIDLDLDPRDIVVPPLFLQPFLENAIWHGISSSSIKNIHLNIKKEEEHIKIELSDTGIGMDYFSESKINLKQGPKRYGIRIVKDTLKNFYEDFQLTYHNLESEGKKSGTLVELIIPMKRKSVEDASKINSTSA